MLGLLASAAAAMATRLQKSMLQPITVIFKFLTTKTRVVIWLYEQPATRIEGRLLGFGACRARQRGGLLQPAAAAVAKATAPIRHLPLTPSRRRAAPP